MRLKSTGIADTCFIGPEAEFFIFDDVRFDQNAHEGYYHLDSIEGEWNRGRDERRLLELEWLLLQDLQTHDRGVR